MPPKQQHLRACLLVIVFSFFLSECQAQLIELNFGFNQIKLYDNIGNESPHIGSTYNTNLGTHIGIGYYDSLANVKGESAKSFYLSYDRFQGGFSVHSGGLGSNSSTNAKFDRHTLGLSYFLLNYSLIKNRVFFSLGPEASLNVKSTLVGTESYWDISGNSGFSDIDKADEDRIMMWGSFGLRARLRGMINITDRLAISPKYDFHFGITKEIDTNQTRTKKLMHVGSLGLVWKL